MRDESSPPLRYAPTGTSERSRRRVASCSSSPSAAVESAVEPLDHAGAVFFVEMQEDFGVRLSAEAMALADELLAKFDVVEDFAVEGDPERAVGARHRLAAAGQIENAQSRVREARARLDVD